MAPKRGGVGAKSSKRESSATRELAEIEVLSQRCIDEAPEPGSNILDTDKAEISVGRGRRRMGARENFTDLPISQRTIAGLAKGKWQRMTDIQRAAIPHALAGRDVLGAAKTGSGKTLAFLVPVIELLYRERWSRLDGLGALVISPTRELALQIFDVLARGRPPHDLSAGLVIGGKDKAEEAERITRMNLLVCTPGRLLQHLDETPGFDASNLSILVLDEADRILDMGFHTALSAIVQGLPKQRQTLLFSATQTKDVKALARLSLRHPQYIGVHEKAAVSTPSRLEQHYMQVRAEEKLDVLFGFVRSHLQAKTLVFLSSCKQVQFVHAAFSAMRPGVPLLCLHGRQKQMKRFAIYTDFCNKSHCVSLRDGRRGARPRLSVGQLGRAGGLPRGCPHLHPPHRPHRASHLERARAAAAALGGGDARHARGSQGADEEADAELEAHPLAQAEAAVAPRRAVRAQIHRAARLRLLRALRRTPGRAARLRREGAAAGACREHGGFSCRQGYAY